MSNKVTAITAAAPKRAMGLSVIAHVAAVIDGRAIVLGDLVGLPGTLDVCDHADTIGDLSTGDRVVALITPAGAVITHALTGQRAPLQRDAHGKLIVRAGQGLTIEAGRSRLELTPEGRILLDGEHVTAQALERLDLHGAEIYVN